MDDRRCPLCGGILLGEVCADCGFECLAEDEIAASYDFNPDNDYFGEPAPMNSADESEDISAADDESESFPASPLQSSYGKVSQKIQPNVNHNMPYANGGNHNNVSSPQSVLEIIIQDCVNYIKKHWWKMLLTLIFPLSGLIIGYIYCAFGGNGRNWVKYTTGVAYILAAILFLFNGIGFTGI